LELFGKIRRGRCGGCADPCNELAAGAMRRVAASQMRSAPMVFSAISAL
jgi:hypothetical protein